jgi:hypothetical protein
MRLADSLFIDYCTEKQIQWFDGYAEPGYTDKGKGVLVANWNEESRAGEIAERLGYETEWFDEWISCDECMKLVRREPSSYIWLPAFIALDNGGHIVCKTCFAEDRELFLRKAIEQYENQPRKALPFWVEEAWMEELGYFEYGQSKVTGLHRFQDDSPDESFRELSTQYDSVVFQMTDKGQFEVNWIIWLRRYCLDEEPEAEQIPTQVVVIHRHVGSNKEAE